jgi:two-component system LytT family sensor kinase
MRLFEKQWNRIGAQVLLWVCLLGSMGLMFQGTNLPIDFYYRTLVHIAVALVIILYNSLMLIPRYFAKKNYGKYGLIVLGSLILIVILAVAIEDQSAQKAREAFVQEQLRQQQLNPNESAVELDDRPRGPRKPPGFIDPRYILSFIMYSAIFLVGTVMESVQLNRKQEHQATAAQNEKLETELKFLKSQINPHFLFNALNNVYTLSLIQSEQTPEVVMKLSEMLRYMLYDSSQNWVTLDQEIAYIQNYISLQELKDDDPLDITGTFEVNNPKVQIAPMILIPFVENAFKHSKIEDTENGWIKIVLLEDGKEIRFAVSNSIGNQEATKDPTGGIGLKNVQRRLELEYPGKHQLSVEQEHQQFIIQLVIDLT